MRWFSLSSSLYQLLIVLNYLLPTDSAYSLPDTSQNKSASHPERLKTNPQDPRANHTHTLAFRPCVRQRQDHQPSALHPLGRWRRPTDPPRPWKSPRRPEAPSPPGIRRDPRRRHPPPTRVKKPRSPPRRHRSTRMMTTENGTLHPLGIDWNGEREWRGRGEG